MSRRGGRTANFIRGGHLPNKKYANTSIFDRSRTIQRNHHKPPLQQFRHDEDVPMGMDGEQGAGAAGQFSQQRGRGRLRRGQRGNHRGKYYNSRFNKKDNVHTPPAVAFEIEEAKVILPSIIPSFVSNEEARCVVATFVEQYYKIYDGENKESLLEAYHEEAVFTLESAYLRLGRQSSGAEPPISRLNLYFNESRNLKRNPDKNRIERCLHRGKLDIVGFISRLPKSTHDVNGFSIDLTIASPTLIHFTITGCFQERGGEKETALRYFQRSFILVPRNQGFVILNEMLFITNATRDQTKAAFSPPVQNPMSTQTLPVPSMSSVSLQVPPVMVELPNIPSLSINSAADTKNEMIKKFAMESTMNEAWAAKCLEQNEWNYEKSAHVFTELHKSGNIPAEAFVK